MRRLQEGSLIIQNGSKKNIKTLTRKCLKDIDNPIWELTRTYENIDSEIFIEIAGFHIAWTIEGMLYATFYFDTHFTMCKITYTTDIPDIVDLYKSKSIYLFEDQ